MIHKIVKRQHTMFFTAASIIFKFLCAHEQCKQCHGWDHLLLYTLDTNNSKQKVGDNQREIYLESNANC